MRLHEDLIAVNAFDLADGDDVRFVNADKMPAIEVLFEVFEVKQGNVFAFERMDGDVVLQPLNEENVVEEDLLVFAAAFDKKIILLRFGRCRPGEQFVVIPALARRLDKALESDRFEQIIHHIELETFQRIARVGRCNDRHRRVLHDFQKVDAAHFGHLNIEKNQVDRFAVHEAEQLNGVFANARQFQKIHFLYIIRQSFTRQRFIVDYHAVDHLS